MLDTFPIVRREDEKAFGHYRTKALILAYMNALAAGDTGTRVSVLGDTGGQFDGMLIRINM